MAAGLSWTMAWLVLLLPMLLVINTALQVLIFVLVLASLLSNALHLPRLFTECEHPHLSTTGHWSRTYDGRRTRSAGLQAATHLHAGDVPTAALPAAAWAGRFKPAPALSLAAPCASLLPTPTAEARAHTGCAPPPAPQALRHCQPTPRARTSLCRRVLTTLVSTIHSASQRVVTYGGVA
jgi:hypothetical protein